MTTERNTERVQVVVIGGGQAACPSAIRNALDYRLSSSMRTRARRRRMAAALGLASLVHASGSTASWNAASRAESAPTKDDMANYLEVRGRLRCRTTGFASTISREGSLHRVGRSAVDRDLVTVAMPYRSAQFAVGGLIGRHLHCTQRSPNPSHRNLEMLWWRRQSGADTRYRRTHHVLAGRSTGKCHFESQSDCAPRCRSPV
jgi:hypothetical protein